MLNYSVIDKRLRTYLGTVQGETHLLCWKAARAKFETPMVRIDCYPSPPEYKGPPRLETEDIAPVVSLRPGNGSEPEPNKIPLGYLRMDQAEAEAALLQWARDKYPELPGEFKAGIGVFYQGGSSIPVVEVCFGPGSDLDQIGASRWGNYLFGSRRYQK